MRRILITLILGVAVFYGALAIGLPLFKEQIRQQQLAESQEVA